MPVSDRSTLETKAKDPERQRKGKTSHETHMKKLKEKLLKDNQEVKMTLKRIYRIFSARLERSSITIIAIEETMRIMKEEHNAEINISIRMI